MSELEDRINAVLSDPQQLQQLTEMASRLMGGLSSGGEASTPAEASSPAATNPLGNTGLPAMLTQVMQNMKPGKKSPLLDAMAPYLNDQRRAKLERSLHIASAARLAGNAFKNMGGGHGL